LYPNAFTCGFVQLDHKLSIYIEPEQFIAFAVNVIVPTFPVALFVFVSPGTTVPFNVIV